MAFPDGWTHYYPITIQDANIDANLTDKDFLIKIEGKDFAEARADGYDIRFTLDDGETLLSYHRILFSKTGDNADLIYRVKMSPLATGGLAIRCYFGKSDAADGEDRANTYDAFYEAIFHGFDQSSSLVHEAVDLGHGDKSAADEPAEIAGFVHKAQDFGGKNDNFYFDTNEGYNTDAWTIQYFLYYPGSDNGLRYTSDGVPTNKRATICYSNTDKAQIYNAGYPTGTASDTEIDIAGDIWQQIAFVTDGTNLWGYKNGVQQWYWANTDLDTSGMTNYNFGIKTGVGNAFAGKLENIKISSTNRAVAWIKAEWHNCYEGDHEQAWGSKEAAGPTVYSITIDPGSFIMAGQAVGLKHDSKVLVAPGGFVYTGQSAALKKDSKLLMAPGAYTYAGQTVGLLKESKLSIEAGAYTYAGQIITLLKDSKLMVAAGSFIYTGQIVEFKYGYVISIEAGSFTYTGQAVNFKYDRIFHMDPGTYIMTGQVVNLLKDSLLGIEPGSYIVIGQAVGLLKDSRLAISPGSFIETGQIVNLLKDGKLVIDAGSFIMAGQAVGLYYDRKLSAASGSYIYTGSDVTLTKTTEGYSLIIEPGSFVFTGQPATLLKDSKIIIVPASYVFNGKDVVLDLIIRMATGSQISREEKELLLIDGKKPVLIGGKEIIFISEDNE